MIDAASMDFGASTDHQGGSHDYWWWYSQKMTDMYHIPGAYVSLFGFERSVPYPGGHHNVLYSNRSGRVIPYFMRGGVSQYRLGASPQGDEPGVTSPPGAERGRRNHQQRRRRKRYSAAVRRGSSHGWARNSSYQRNGSG